MEHFLDPHIYSDKPFNKFYFYELKGTGGYKLSKHVIIAGGAGKYETYRREGNLQLPIQTNETRLFEQLLLGHNIHSLRVDQRFQLEQRFFNSFYRNRLRYRVNLTLPINKPVSQPNSFSVAAYDELFLTETSPPFCRKLDFWRSRIQSE